MIKLSSETEILARRLATARGVSIEDAVRQAIEHSACEAGLSGSSSAARDGSPQAVATRIASMERIADEIAAMPLLDPRSPREIMDALNAP